MMKNKRGMSLSGVTEAALFSVLIISLLVILSSQMNTTYSTNNDLSYGMSGLTAGTLGEANNFSGTLQTGSQGETTNTQTGISLTSVWSMILGGITISWNFVSGQWISQAIGLLHLGPVGTILATILRLLFIFGIGFIIVKLIMKVRA